MNDHLDTQALQAITALQRPGKPDLLKRVLGLFESESPKSLLQIQTGLAEQDIEKIRFGSHSLKSSSANVGAMLLSQRCKELEAAARSGDLSQCQQLEEDLIELHQLAVKALQAYQQDQAA
ncbi:MAG: Hpt domain-containing protein [Gammaproteobacteria bacterium]|nr:Hpt domain-containing protein [Gammaproteobacteria bacterium]